MKAQTKSLGNTFSSLPLYPSSWPWQADGLPGSVHTSLDRMEASKWMTETPAEQQAVQSKFAESREAAQEKSVPSSVQPWSCSAQAGGAGSLFMDDLLAASQLPAMKLEMADTYSMLNFEQPGMMKQTVASGRHESQALNGLRPHSALSDVPKPTTPTANDLVRFFCS